MTAHAPLYARQLLGGVVLLTFLTALNFPALSEFQRPLDLEFLLEEPSRHGSLQNQRRQAQSIVQEQRPAKQFVYMIQGTKMRYQKGLVPNEQRDVHFLCFKEECERDAAVPTEDVFVHPDASFTKGRNLQLQHALERSQSMTNGGVGYLYYIYLDSDVPEMLESASATDPWKEFEAWLLQTQPAVGYIADGTGFEVPFNVDANLNAFHRNTLGLLLPYDESLDPAGGCYSQYLHNMLISATTACQRFGYYKGGMRLDWQQNRHDRDSVERNFASWAIPKNYYSTLFKGNALSTTALHAVNGGAGNGESNVLAPYYSCCRKEHDNTQLVQEGPVDAAWINKYLNPNHPLATTLLSFQQRHGPWLATLRRQQQQQQQQGAGTIETTTATFATGEHSNYGLEAACHDTETMFVPAQTNPTGAYVLKFKIKFDEMPLWVSPRLWRLDLTARKLETSLYNAEMRWKPAGKPMRRELELGPGVYSIMILSGLPERLGEAKCCSKGTGRVWVSVNGEPIAQGVELGHFFQRTLHFPHPTQEANVTAALPLLGGSPPGSVVRPWSVENIA